LDIADKKRNVKEQWNKKSRKHGKQEHQERGKTRNQEEKKNRLIIFAFHFTAHMASLLFVDERPAFGVTNTLSHTKVYDEAGRDISSMFYNTNTQSASANSYINYLVSPM
jgi:hypothetical protein